MRKRLALLCYRVARWLAPSLFADTPQSLLDMRMRIGMLRNLLNEMSPKKLDSTEGQYILKELRNIEGQYKAAAAFDGGKYEQVKVEIQTASRETAKGLRNMSDEELRKLDKLNLFKAMVDGFAQSAEIEKFMYYRAHGALKTVGIRLYLKHDN